MFRQGFTCLALLNVNTWLFAYEAITRYGGTFQTLLLSFGV
jgi:hypothetical protein